MMDATPFSERNVQSIGSADVTVAVLPGLAQVARKAPLPIRLPCAAAWRGAVCGEALWVTRRKEPALKSGFQAAMPPVRSGSRIAVWNRATPRRTRPVALQAGIGTLT
jgi:hypothetical protein